MKAASILMFISFTLPALAGDGEGPKEEKKPEVSVNGAVFARYSYDLTEEAEGFNEFAIDRAYFIAKAKLPAHFGAKITLDADHIKPVEAAGEEVEIDGKYRVFLKHALIEWKAGEAAPWLSIKGGMVDTPYTGYFDSFWGHRYVSKGTLDEHKVLNTADLGLNVQGKHGDDGCHKDEQGAGCGLSWVAAVYNGEGYSHEEQDKSKSAQLRLTADPLGPKGRNRAPITAFVDYNAQTEADPIITAIGAAGFKEAHVTLWGEAALRKQGDLQGMTWSASVLPSLARFGRVVLRYDHHDPDVDTEDDGDDKLIAGFSHDFADKVAGAATFERLSYEVDPAAPVQGLHLHFTAGF